MKKLFATRKVRVALAVTLGLAMGAGIAMPRIAAAAGRVDIDDATPPEGNFGTPSFDVTFRLSAPSTSSVTVGFSTVDGGDGNATNNASSATDYVAKSGSVVFAPGETTKPVSFQTRGDTAFEVDEDFTIQVTSVSSSDSYAFDANSHGLVTIQDDDVAPTVSVDDPQPTQESAGSMVFPVKLSKPSGSSFSVRVFTANPRDPSEVPPVSNAPRPATESPTANFDYTSVDNQQVTFAPGETVKNVSVPLVNDTRDEFDEFIELQVREDNAGSAELDFATGQLVDDDAAPRLDVGDPVAVQEGSTPCGHIGDAQQTCTTVITFTVTKNGATDKTVIVDYRTEDRSATSGSNDPNADYNGESGSGDPGATPPGSGLSFAPNETTKQISVGIRGDTTPEPDEIFAFIIENPVNATLGDSQAIGLISNDDGGSFATVSVGNAASAAEASGGTPGSSQFTITVTRPLGNTQNVNVCYATADGPESGNGAAAVAGSDYVAQNACTTINFPSGSTNVNVPLINNNVNEPDEFFQLQLLSAGNAAITDAAGEARITDDDPAPTLSIADRTIAEGTSGSATNATLTVTMSAASGQTVTVNCSTPQPNSGTATADTDYTVTNQTLTFVPGDTSENCTVPVAADAVDENNETVAVALANATGGATINDGAAVLTITDDDNPPTVSIANTTVTEGSDTNPEATFQVSLSGPSSKTITVNVATANGSATAPADYTSKSQTLTFNPGVTTQDFKVTVIADTIDEADETFTAELTSPTNATLGTPSTATATIEDDEDAPTLAINNATLNEGNSGTTNATFTVTLSPSTAQQVTVNYATADGTATQPGDYTQTTGTLTFAPGETSKQINVPVKGDTTVETDENFSVNLTAPTNATLNDASGTGTITNDDSVTPTTTTTTTLPGGVTPKIGTGPGPGGGPHIRTFNANGTAASTDFFDGSDTTGKRVAMGDVNGDGRDEIITGTGVNSAGVVSVYNASEQLIASTFPYANGNWFGGIFVAAGDVDGDGKAEVITSVGPGGGPHVKVWDVVGQTLVEVAGFYAYTNAQGQPNWNGGVTVAAGNLDADAAWEIVTGVGAGGGPHVKAFDVTVANNVMSFAEKFGFYAYTNAQGQPNWNGGVNVAAGDLNNDGRAEIATAPWPGGGPHLRLFNSDGSLRHPGIFASTDPTFNGGLTVAMGDLDGDGNAEVIVASMTKLAGVRTYKADLTSFGVNFTAYPNFNGGVWVAAGKL